MLPDVVKQIKLTVSDMLADVHTAMPGTIKRVDAAAGRVTVLPFGEYKTSDGKVLAYPAITGVPLLFPCGAALDVGIVFPVKEGDGCLVLIAEQSLDTWLYGGKPQSDLKHDLTNAVAIPGLFTAAMPSLEKACSENAVVVTAGDTSIVASGSGVKITGDVTILGDVTIQGSLTTSGGTVNLN